jgi:hypothetical protein
MPDNGTSNPITGVLNNTTTTKKTVVFTVTATNDGCSSSTTFEVQVNPLITNNKVLASHVSEVSICGSPRQVTISSPHPRGGDGNYTYQWQVSSTNSNFADIPGATEDTLVYSTESNLYFRRIAFSGGCSNTSAAVQVSASAGNTSSIVKSCTGGSGIDIVVVAGYAGAVYRIQNDKTGVWLDVADQAPITGTGTLVTFPNNKLTGHYRVTATIGGCTQIVSDTVEILPGEIPQKPTSATATPSPVCAGSPINLVAIVPGASDANGASVYWYTVPEGGEVINPDPVASGGSFQVTPDSTTTYYAKSIYTATGCKSSDRTAVTVMVNPVPEITSTDSTGICTGSTVNIALTNTIGAGTTFSWIAADNPNTTGESTTSQNAPTLSNTITNNTNAAQTVIYTVTATVTATGCTSDSQTVSVRVDPIPVIAAQTAKVCSGTGFIITPADGGGNIVPSSPVTQYSWAAPTGSGFTGGMSGSGANIIGTLTNTTSSAATATYQVIPSAGACTGSPFSLTVTINAGLAANTAVWTGSVSSNWCVAANWQCNVIPDATRDVVIPPGTANQPAVTGACNAITRNIDVRGTATLAIATGSNINIYGSIVNTDAARYTLNGTVTFAGGNQDIPAFTYNGLRVMGGGTKTLLGAVLVNGTLTLNNGIIKTDNAAMLTIAATGSATPGSDLSYVEGPLTRLTNSTVTYNFPVGANGAVRPATVTPVDGSASSYTVYYHHAATGGNVPGPDLLAVQSNEYWDITKNSGAEAIVGMYYKNLNALPADAATSDWSNGMNPCVGCNVAVVWKDGSGNWNFTGASGGFGPNQATHWQSNNFVDSRQVPGTSGQFSFGYADATLLAVQLVYFKGSLQGNNSLLEWKYAGGNEIAGTELQHSTDGRHFDKLAILNAGNTDNYSYRHLNLREGAHFYRLLIRDRAGKFAYSPTVLLVVGKNITVIRDIRPTMTRNETFIGIHSAKSQTVQATLLDIAGRNIGEYRGSLLEGDNNFRINTLLLARGSYMLQVKTEDGVQASLRFIKE